MARTTALVLLCLLVWGGAVRAEPLRVATTTPDLASLVESVGGDAVEVTAFVRGGQDPHFVEARPSFIRVLSRSDLFVRVGLQLEAGWVPALVRSARNGRILPGASGDLDASTVIPRRGVIGGVVDRSMGDVHAEGNPHYLVDPVNGIRVARAIRDRLVALRVELTPSFRANTAAFEEAILSRLVGEVWVVEYGALTLAEAILVGRLPDGADESKLGGWLGAMRPHRGRAVVADHDLWPYFAERFGIEVAAFLEPLPGITPTTKHLAEIAGLMKRQGIHVILSASYFHPRYAKKVAKATGARVVEMANQVGAREGVDDYLEMIDWNVRQVANALD
jgi:ABC-type Zn uptake system ZnuABC Zn-binding protein ZnuA